MSDIITCLTHSRINATKTWKEDGTIKISAMGKYFNLEAYKSDNIIELSAILKNMELQNKSFIIRGKYGPDKDTTAPDAECPKGKVRRTLGGFADQPLHMVMFDIDNFQPFLLDSIEETADCINEYIEDKLPSCFHDITYHWQLSSSAGKPNSNNILKVHIWFYLRTPYTSKELKRWAIKNSIDCDTSLFTSIQPHFTASPIFADGVNDPVKQRSGLVRGTKGDEVDLIIHHDAFNDAQHSSTQQQVARNAIDNDPVSAHLEQSKLFKSHRSDGGLNISCPYIDEHSVDSTETSTIYYPQNTGGYKNGAFKCMHQSCGDRSKADYLEKLDLAIERLFVARDQTGIARQMIEDRFTSNGACILIKNYGNYYYYKDNHYVRCNEQAIRAEVRKYLDESKRYLKNGKLAAFHPSMADINGVLDAISSSALLESVSPPIWLKGHENNEANNFVSFNNGILDIDRRKLLPHSPHFFTLNTLPYDYVDNGIPEGWIQFLNEIFNRDQESIDTLQEIFGYVITPITFMQKMFMIVGLKRSGKGTIARVLGELLGKSNVCGSNLNNLAKGFGLQPLKGKLLTTFPDVRIGGKSDIKAIIGTLLSVTGEDDITIDMKYKDHWNGKLTTRFLLISNELPQFADANDALSNRFIYLKTVASFFGKEDVYLTDRLLNELPQIFLWALNGRERLLGRGCFKQPKISAHLLDDNEKLSNPIIDFIEDECDLNASYSIRKGCLYESYQCWCDQNGYKHPKTLAVFARDLQSTDSSIQSSRISVKGKRIRIFSGIKLNDPRISDSIDI